MRLNDDRFARNNLDPDSEGAACLIDWAIVKEMSAMQWAQVSNKFYRIVPE